jgi:hypothetical protein
MIERVYDKVFGPKDLVILDNKAFIGCTFNDCVIVYAGGFTSFEECVSSGCTFRFTEAAYRTGGVFKTFGLLHPDAEQMFREGTEKTH